MNINKLHASKLIDYLINFQKLFAINSEKKRFLSYLQNIIDNNNISY